MNTIMQQHSKICKVLLQRTCACISLDWFSSSLVSEKDMSFIDFNEGFTTGSMLSLDMTIVS